MRLDDFTRLYLDWVNNFLTVERFAEHYQISIEDAQEIIRLGREVTMLTPYKVVY